MSELARVDEGDLRVRGRLAATVAPSHIRFMRRIPEGATAGMNDAELAIVDAWWGGLAETEQREFETLWDSRTDDTALYAIEVDGNTEWHELPLQLRGHFVDREAHREDAMWKQMLCEYVNSHEVKFYLEHRTFHVCRSHAKAREVLATLRIEADFTCPVDRGDCPFAAASRLAKGRAIDLAPDLARRRA